MNCKTARGLFSLHLDAGLSYEEQRHLSQHLDLCSSCNLGYKKVSRTVSLLRELPVVEPSSDFHDGVMRAMREARDAGSQPAVYRPTLRERVGGWYRSLAWEGPPRWAYAAAVLVLGLGVGYYGSMKVPHYPQVPLTAQHESTGTINGPATPMATAGGENVPETQMPSGPFEQLVKEMLVRAESADQAATDSSSTSVPDWSSGWGADPHAQQVGASAARRGERNREGSVYIVF